MKKDFNLITQCTFNASAKTVWNVTVDVKAYPEWWPCMQSVVIQGGEDTLQRHSNIHYRIKGFLPHALCFQTYISECIPLSRIEMTVSGDLEGVGVSTLKENHGLTRACFQWDVSLTRPALNRLSQWSVLHKLFVLNHDFAMRYAVRNMRKRVDNVAS